MSPNLITQPAGISLGFGNTLGAKSVGGKACRSRSLRTASADDLCVA